MIQSRITEQIYQYGNLPNASYCKSSYPYYFHRAITDLTLNSHLVGYGKLRWYLNHSIFHQFPFLQARNGNKYIINSYLIVVAQYLHVSLRNHRARTHRIEQCNIF
jgi:hypothetical protein